MTDPLQLFIVFVLVGLLLVAMEVIIPGGVLGIFGGVSLLAAIIAGYAAFGLGGGVIATVSIVILVGLVLFVWVEVFPHTGAGRLLTLSRDTKTFKSNPDQLELVGKVGEALTDLRPAGTALIDSHRVDVISDGQWINKGAAIKVIEVEGIRVAVREIEST